MDSGVLLNANPSVEAAPPTFRWVKHEFRRKEAKKGVE
jgi:hypothetical protein